MSDTRTDRSDRVAQVAWLVVAASATSVWVLAPALQWNRFQRVCRTKSSCAGFQLSHAGLRSLTQHGLGLHFYALGTAIVLAALWMLWYGAGALIIWRKPNDRGAVLTAFFLALFPVWEASAWVLDSAVAQWMTVFFLLVLVVFALLFPDGSFRPGWTRWLALLVLLENIALSVTLPADLAPLLEAVLNIAYWLTFVAVAGALIYRYRALSTWSEKQQTKWAFFGMGLAILGIFAMFVPVSSLFYMEGGLFASLTNTVGVALIVTVIPVSLTIAVLRSGLWDIDRIISRVLAWSALTIILVTVYVGGVIGLEAVFGTLIGKGSAAAIAISTLAIVALFGPLRRRIQSFIDRRFYRSRYDAARTVAAFGEKLRDEVDLGQLCYELTGVVSETLHPERVSLWLREGGGL